MENSQTIATDSFSYSWLINRKPPIFDSPRRPSLGGGGGGDVDCNSLPPVMHAVLLHQDFIPCPNNNNDNSLFFLKNEVEEEDFDFKVNGGCADHLIIPADEIFSDGSIKPVYHHYCSCSTRAELVSSSTTTTTTPLPIPPPPAAARNRRRWRRRSQYCLILMMRKWSKSSLAKCFEFLKNRVIIRFCWFSRNRVRVIDQFLDRNNVGIVSSSRSDDSQLIVLHHVAPTSPPVSPLPPPSAGRRSCDVENSIQEAILHCKRSFGQREICSSMKVEINVEELQR